MRKLQFLMLACGALGVLAFAPFNFYPLAWLAAAGFYIGLGRATSPGIAMRLGLAFGLGHFGAGVSWVYVSMHDVGGMPLPLAALATLLFCLTLALFPAMVAVAMHRLAPAAAWRRSLLFAALWMLGEWLRSWVFTGFPWLLLGSSQTPPSPLAGYVPLIGALGLSFMVSFIGALLAEAVLHWRRYRLATVYRVGLVTTILLAGSQLGDMHWTKAVGQPLSVALLQGNIEQELKWRPEHFRESLVTYHQLMREHPAQLTVFPETALPSFYDRLPPDYLDDLRRLARRQQGDALLGVVIGHGSVYRNAAVSLGSGVEQVYVKSHLVPFGEFVPAGFSWFMDWLDMPLAGFLAGPAEPAPLTLAGQRIAVNICYEDVFASEIANRAAAATLLINLSNTAWFGHSLAQPQHLQIARMRALETGRPMLRATNTGMTALIEADGRVAAVLPPFSRDALVVQVRGREGLTPYLRAGNVLVLLLAWVIALAEALAMLFLRRRHSH